MVIYVGFEFCIWMVGWFICISLSGLHSCMDSFRLVICRGGCINLLSFDCMWLRQLAYVWMVLLFCLVVVVLCIQ